MILVDRAKLEKYIQNLIEAEKALHNCINNGSHIRADDFYDARLKNAQTSVDVAFNELHRYLDNPNNGN